MKNSNNGRSVPEMKLFHGTDNQHVDTICHTNFDWRLCGSHGTAYGKGYLEDIVSMFYAFNLRLAEIAESVYFKVQV